MLVRGLFVVGRSWRSILLLSLLRRGVLIIARATTTQILVPTAIMLRTRYSATAPPLAAVRGIPCGVLGHVHGVSLPRPPPPSFALVGYASRSSSVPYPALFVPGLYRSKTPLAWHPSTFLPSSAQYDVPFPS